MTLHLINKSPDNSPALAECLDLLKETEEDSALLLIEDAVYAVLKNSQVLEQLQQLDKPCYVLIEDLQARALSGKLAQDFKQIDYAGFVALTLEYARVQSWA